MTTVAPKVFSSRTISLLEASYLIPVDAFTAPVTLTLPSASVAGNGFAIHIQKDDGGRFPAFVSSVGNQLLGAKGPTMDITSVTASSPGAPVKLITDEQRFFTTGRQVLVEDVTGTVEANGLHLVTRINDATAIELQGTTYANAWTGGGKVSLVRTIIALRVLGSFVKLVSDGTNWIIEGSSLDVLQTQDVLIDENAGYDGFDWNAGLTVCTDFWYNSRFRRLALRSIMLSEVGDPVDIGIRRTDTAAGSTHPNGPNFITTSGSGINIGAIYWQPWSSANNFQNRIAQVYARTSQPAIYNSCSGMLVWGTTPTNGQSPVDRMYLQANGQLDIGGEQSHGKVNVLASSEIGYFARSTSGSYGNALFRGIADRSASNAFHFFLGQSDAGNDTEFSLRGDGNAFADGSWSGGGADYAEMVREWWDGNPDGEDRGGKSVVLVHRDNPDKVVFPGRSRPVETYIRTAESLTRWQRFSFLGKNPVIGAVSANPVVKGGGAWNAWEGKYLRDELGRVITEAVRVYSWTTLEENAADLEDAAKRPNSTDPDDSRSPALEEKHHTYVVEPGVASIPDYVKGEAEWVQRKVLNPKYDPNAIYEPREARKEWDFVALLGRVFIFEGQPIGKRWTPLSSKSSGVNEWLVQ